MYSVHVLNGVAGGPLAYAAVHGGHAEPGEVNPHHLTEKKIFLQKRPQRSSLILGDRISQIPCRASYFASGPRNYAT